MTESPIPTTRAAQATPMPGTTVSEGTLRSEDLVSAFLSELRQYKPQSAVVFEQRNPELILNEAHPDYRTVDPDLVTDGIDWLLEELNSIIPGGARFYFGSIEGDPACYGWWESPRENDDESEGGFTEWEEEISDEG